MKKAIIIIAAIAVLGLLGLRSQHKSTALAGGNTTGQAISQTATPSQTNPSPTGSGSANANYKDGTYTGSTTDTPYGNVQVAAVISGGKIIDIKFLQMPNSEPESMQRTSFSEPALKQSALASQSASIDFVTGATDTSFGFEQSLQAALNQASA